MVETSVPSGIISRVMKSAATIKSAMAKRVRVLRNIESFIRTSTVKT
jgi:hypothetical protein